MILLPKDTPLRLSLNILIWLLTLPVTYYAYKGQSTDSKDPMINDISLLKSAGKMTSIEYSKFKYTCVICDSYVSSKAKHCSSCNKCVAEFDHHCEWLNNCIG